MSAEYTNPDFVSDIRVTDTPWSGRTVSGYGRKIPTRYMIRYMGRWHRVYAMAYGNSSSVYIVSKGMTLFLDTNTEHNVSEKGSN